MRLAFKILAAFTATFLILAISAALIFYLVLGRQRIKETEVTAGEVSRETGTYRVTLEHDGRQREYLIHVPPLARTGAPLPLVIALHGGAGTAERTEGIMHILPIADREGFLVAFPQGIGKSWNDGRPDSKTKAFEQNVDDVGFIRALIDDVSKRLAVDPKRVYATGMSNGAFMSNRLACEASDRIAAVALVAGTAPLDPPTTCRPSRPVPIVIFLSTDDPLVPYQGGDVQLLLPFIKRGKALSATAWKHFWVEGNGCRDLPSTIEMPDLTDADNSRVIYEAYSGCKAGADIDFYRLEGAGHTWPGGTQYVSPWLVGTTNRDINASELLWRFFAAHTLP